MKLGGHATGKSLHGPLRYTRVALTADDFTQRRCIACSKPIHDDRDVHLPALTCSKRCCSHVTYMRAAGKPIQWDGHTKRPTGNRKPRTATEKAAQSQRMREWYRKQRAGAV